MAFMLALARGHDVASTQLLASPLVGGTLTVMRTRCALVWRLHTTIKWLSIAGATRGAARRRCVWMYYDIL